MSQIIKFVSIYRGADTADTGDTSDTGDTGDTSDWQDDSAAGRSRLATLSPAGLAPPSPAGFTSGQREAPGTPS